MTETQHAPDCLADFQHVADEARVEVSDDIVEAWDTDLTTATTFAIRRDVTTSNYGPNQMYAYEGLLDHHTAGSRSSDLSILTRSGSGVSSNYYVTKSGEIFELVKPPRRAWHAGTADGGTPYRYDGNSYYIGIEIENYGNGSDPYPRAQVDAIVWLHRYLRRTFNAAMRLVFRHRDFAPSRKVDTSNNFPFEEVKRRTLAATDPTDAGGINPKQFKHAKYTVITDPKMEWPKSRAEWLKKNLPASLVSFTSDPGEVYWIGEKAYNAKYGTVGVIALGLASRGMLSSLAVDGLGYGMKTSDVWKAFSDLQMAKCLRFMVSRDEISKEVVDRYVEEFEVEIPENPTPNPSNASVIDDYFREAGTTFGSYVPIGKEIVEEAARAGLMLEDALAMVTQESYGRNIFGCDHGARGDYPPYCRQAVTKDRVKALIASPHMNGVGVTQLTWWSFVLQAEKLGGAHLVVNQLRVGFELLSGYFERYGRRDGAGAYNAGEARRTTVRNTYSASFLRHAEAWKERLA